MLERYEELSVGESPAADQSNPWIGPGLITIVFGLLTLWSWRRWPDLLVDFGRELYSPWQLAGGKLLYRDVASLFGPFSQYFNAVGFRLFGVSFTFWPGLPRSLTAYSRRVSTGSQRPRFQSSSWRCSDFLNIRSSATTTSYLLIRTKRRTASPVLC